MTVRIVNSSNAFQNEESQIPALFLRFINSCVKVTRIYHLLKVQRHNFGEEESVIQMSGVHAAQTISARFHVTRM
jgi:hypothetical protein